MADYRSRNQRNMKKLFCVVIFCLTFLANSGHSARILGVFPTASISHQVVFRALTLALNERGHELVVLTTDPIGNATLKNYKEISLHFIYDMIPKVNYIENRNEFDEMGKFREFFISFALFCEDKILQIPEFEKIYSPDSGEKFDLILIEILFSPAFYALSARFNAPIIGITSLAMPLTYEFTAGFNILSSHPSYWEMGSRMGYELPFWQRVKNFILVWRYIYIYNQINLPMHQEIAKKYFGDDIPHLTDIEKNVSLMIVNQQPVLSHIKPTLPNVINIFGSHVSKKIPETPKDLKKFLDEAHEGFVYMSLGSNAKSIMLPDKSRDEITAAFSKLPHRVLWKYENDTLPGKPDNVRIEKWLPQQAILAHPNIKAFVYQGGLQSTEEAVSHVVPLVGLPVFADQDSQVIKMVSLGVARKLEICTIYRNDLEEAILDVISNKSYKENMLKVRSLVNDRPYDSLENAIWWTEFVIRHKGAPHLRSSILDVSWYQRFDHDIIVFLSIVTFALIIFLLFIVMKVTFFILSIASSTKGAKKRKSN